MVNRKGAWRLASAPIVSKKSKPGFVFGRGKNRRRSGAFRLAQRKAVAFVPGPLWRRCPVQSQWPTMTKETKDSKENPLDPAFPHPVKNTDLPVSGEGTGLGPVRRKWPPRPCAFCLSTWANHKAPMTSRPCQRW